MARIAKLPPIHLPCHCCGGLGHIELSGIYRQTLDLLNAVGYPVCGAELARRAGCKNEAMCKRLVELEAKGLVTSERFGRKRVFQVAKGIQCQEKS